MPVDFTDDFPAKFPPAKKRIVRLANHRQYSPAMRADLLILPLSSPPEILTAIATVQPVGVEIPRGMFGTQKAVANALDRARRAGAVAALCSNIGALPLARQAALTAIGGFGLNITNCNALSFYSESGLSAATLSVELSFGQMESLLRHPLPGGILLYGRIPLMLTRNCPRSAASGGCAGCHGQGITDRTGTAFPVMCENGCSEILNSVPLYWGDRPEEVPAADFYLFHFTDETAAQAVAVLQAYDRGSAPPPAITRGLYRRGVE